MSYSIKQTRSAVPGDLGSRYKHFSFHEAVITGSGGEGIDTDATTRLALRYHPLLADRDHSPQRKGDADDVRLQRHIDQRITMFKDPSDTYNSDTLLTDDTKLTVTEASVFGEEKLPIQHLCASAMERTHELSKSIEEIEAIRMESILVISSGIGGSVNKMQLQRQAVANRGRTSSIGERQNQTQSKEVKSAGSRIEQLEQDRLQLDELSNSLEMCANDETHSEAMFKGMERTKGTVESFLDQKSKELTSLASRLCPEDSALVESWIDLHRKRAEARASQALFVAVLGRKNTKRRGRPFTDMQQRELQGPKEYVALTKRTYSDSRAHLQEAFHSTYDEKSVGGLPTCVAGWTELWTSPQQQIGQVRLKTALLHPEGDEAHEKAEISQWAVYSVDGGASWAPVAGTIEADGEPFEAPNVTAWQLLDSRGVLPSEHASTTWMQDLDDYLPAPTKKASGESGGSSMPSTHADQMATDWRVTRKPGESRSGYVQRARREMSEALQRTQGPSELERCWNEEARLTKAAFQRRLDVDAQVANPQTEDEKTLFEDWVAMTSAMLDCRQAGVLSHVQETLARYTQGAVHSHHEEERLRYEETWRSKRSEVSSRMASLQDKLHNKYDSCTIPPSGEVWNKRFKSLGELPAEAFASAAPSFIRQQVELEESVRKAIGPTSGGVPSRLRKTFNELAMGSQPTSTHDRRTISSDTVIPNFLNEPEIDSDDDAS